MCFEIKKFDERIAEEALDVLGEAFAEDGVKKIFSEMYPRVFDKNRPEFSQHYAIMNEGKVCGCISNCAMDYHIGGEVLKISASGNVAVSKDMRKRGVMGKLFERVDKALEEENFDFSYLHGARVRYNYFGYEWCGVEYRFIFDLSNLQKVFKNQGKYEFEVLEKNSPLIAEAVKINEMQNGFIKREEDALYPVLASRWSKAVAVKQGGELLGTFSYDEGEIRYLSFKDYSDFSRVLYEFMCYQGASTVLFDIPEHDRELLKNAMKYCSKFTVANPANFKITNFKKVVKAFLQLKADNSNLCDGEITLNSDLFGKYIIRCKNSVVSVEEFDGETRYNLEGFEIYDFLFNYTPNIYGDYDAAVKSWLPIPLYAPFMA